MDVCTPYGVSSLLPTQGCQIFRFLFFFFKIILCVEGFTCVCVVYEWYPQKPEEGTGSPGPGVTGGYQPRVDGGDPA